MVSQKSLEKSPVGILTGPTASGKTALALELAGRGANRGRIEIVNADSLLIFRGMDVGTARPSAAEQAAIPHHLMNLRDPDEGFTAGDFRRAALRAIEEISARGHRALVVGGTGFYLKALLYGMWDAPAADPEIRAELGLLESAALHALLTEKDPDSALRIGPGDRYRLIRALELIRLTGFTPSVLAARENREPDPRFRLWVVDRPRPALDLRIDARTRSMLDQGFLEEARRLLARFSDPLARPRALDSVGYAQAIEYLEGRTPPGRKRSPGLDGLRSEIVLATRQLVKRQRTWFRGEKAGSRFELERDRPALLAEWSRIYE